MTAIASVNYPSPIAVNGFSCRNCTEVDLAKRAIDPAHPLSGPHNRDAAIDPSRRDSDPIKVEALRRAAEQAAHTVMRYDLGGAITGTVVTGSRLSLLA